MVSTDGDRHGQCILVCRVCSADADGPMFMPFSSYRERGRWATAHTKRTGHAAWYCLDGWPTPAQVAEQMAEFDRVAAELMAETINIREW